MGHSREIKFTFAEVEGRPPGEPSEDEHRLIWMLLSLLRKAEVSYEQHYRRFARHARTFARDVAKLRRLGEEHGFAVTRGRDRTIRLAKLDLVPLPSRSADKAGADMLRAVADALGDIVGSSIARFTDVGGTAHDRFLRIATPRLIADSSVAATYGSLRAAWENSARVRFRYPARDGGRLAERTVEPYLVTYYSGRYYLVGFDARPRAGWRQFALDRIEGTIARAGSFSRRPVPTEYRGEDAIGLFKTAGRRDVTIDLSATIAEAVIAREWQRGQRVQRRSDGSATITFEVYDLGEGVRWAFGFGPEAAVIAPAEAIAHARDLLERMFRSSAEPSANLDDAADSRNLSA